MRKCLFMLLCLLLCAATAQAQSLSNALSELVNGSNLGNTDVAFCVIDLDNNQILASRNADLAMIPASNMKLVTTAAALSILGPNYTFTTELGQVSPESPSTKPSIIITADGDPAFGDPVLLLRHGFRVDDLFTHWVDAIKATGQTNFDELLIDDRVFDYEFVHPTWARSDLVKLYGAQVAGLNFHRNCFDIRVTPTVKGQSPRISLFPEAPFIPTINRAVTGSRDFLTRDRRLGTNEIIFGGQIKNRQRAPYYITMHDPAMVFGQMLSYQLKKAGINVTQVRRLAAQELSPNWQPIHRVSTTLQLVLERTNQNSQNMFAEALFKRVGRAVTGEPGSWDNGAAAVRLFLQDKIGTRAASITLADGSGLSRDNRLTANVLAGLLQAMHKDEQLAGPYRASLAQAGVNGTLESRMKNIPAQVLGKSGYIRGVSSLSGYITTQGEQPRHLAFSFIFNGFKPPITNHKVKALQDHMIQTITERTTR